MSRPHSVLLAMARSETTPPPHDLEEFLRSAAEHRMTGLVWSAVMAGELELPSASIQTLAAEDLAVAAHHRRLWSLLEEVTGILTEQGIGVVTFKGVTDEARWFHRQGERPCADVDVVIDDISRFGDAIDALVPGHPLVGHASRMAVRGQSRAVDLHMGGAVVDLHVDPIKVGPGWRHPNMWLARTEDFRTPSGHTVRVFDRGATAALRLLHLGRDNFRTLLGLVEMDRIVASGLDWTDVMEMASMECLAAPIGVAAEVVSEEIGTDCHGIDGTDWRWSLWRSLWAPKIRLLGELGRMRYVRRSQWGLPLSMPGRTLETLGWLVRTAIPPAPLFDLKHPGHSGPYPWRLVTGRTSYLLRRRIEARAERRT